MKTIPGPMRVALAIAIFLAPVCPGLGPAVQAQVSASPPKDFDLTAIDAYIASYVREKGLVGLSVAIMRDGDIVFAKG